MSKIKSPYRSGSIEWEEHIRVKIFNHSVDVDGESGVLVRGYVGSKFKCRYCDSERYDDGTRCKGCGMYHKVIRNVEASEEGM